MNLVETIKHEKLTALQTQATKEGFLLDEFSGFVLIEIESGADLYFGNLNDLECYLNAVNLSEVELHKLYGFPTDSDISE